MANLDIDDARLDVAAKHLRTAGAAVGGARAATGACGSAIVEAALNDAELVVREALDALAGLATSLASDVDAVNTTFTHIDSRLAKDTAS